MSPRTSPSAATRRVGFRASAAGAGPVRAGGGRPARADTSFATARSRRASSSAFLPAVSKPLPPSSARRSATLSCRRSAAVIAPAPFRPSRALLSIGRAPAPAFPPPRDLPPSRGRAPPPPDLCGRSHTEK